MATLGRPPIASSSTLPLNDSRCPAPPHDDTWRWAKWFCGNAFVSRATVRRLSFFAPAATAASAIAVKPAASKPGYISVVAPTAGTNKVPKAVWIIATANGTTGDAKPRRA
jgi:hypothetical protein